MQKKGAAVIIGGVSYSVDDRTPDGFIVMKPQVVWLKARALLDAINANATTLRRVYGESVYQELRSYCAECLSMAEKVSVKALAYKEVGEDRFTYKCLCLCGKSERMYTFMDTFIERLVPRPSAKTAVASRRTAVHVSAAA